MKISLIMDNPRSWYAPHCLNLGTALRSRGHEVTVSMSGPVGEGDLAFYLSYEKRVRPEVRALHTQNLVAHSSDLPKGRGWAPLTWQILEGASTIKNTLFEMTDPIDAGRIMLQNVMFFNGRELLPELHAIQGEMINRLIVEYADRIANADNLPMFGRAGREQAGEPTYYRRRTPEDSKLDISKTFREQFNLLRVCDNQLYPAFFVIHGRRYTVLITGIPESGAPVLDPDVILGELFDWLGAPGNYYYPASLRGYTYGVVIIGA